MVIASMLSEVNISSISFSVLPYEITNSCKIYIRLNNPLIDERANMNIFKVQVLLIFDLMTK
jgi:hypothetical protein